MRSRILKRFLILTLSAASLLFVFLLTGCNNIVENSVDREIASTTSTSDTKPDAEEIKTIVSVSGGLDIRGAFPQEILDKFNQAYHAEPVSTFDFGRTVFPAIPESDLSIEIKAVKVGDTNTVYNASSIDWDSRTFAIGIPVGAASVSYKITADLIYDSKTILSGESESFSISSENPIVNDVEVTLGAKQTTTGDNLGHGKIDLQIEVEDGSDISYCKHSLAGYTYTVSDGVITISMNNATSGKKNVAIWFYNASGDILYRIDESINVYDNLTTNIWVKNGNEPWLVTSGSTTCCRITNAMVEGYKLTEIWVDSSRSTDEMDLNYTTESGTFINPRVSFDDALSMLNNADKDYTIFIKGTLSGNVEIPNTLKNTGSGEEGCTYAHSLTICGDSRLLAGQPQDALNANGSGKALSINTSVPVIIKNLKITGGNTSDNGGGIYIDNSNVKVYLTDGVLVTGNHANKGGGVYLNNGQLFIYGSAVIGKSGVSAHAQDVEEGYGNKATVTGGGIGVGTGILWLGYSTENNPAETSGGVIYNLVKGSAETHGGGIDNQNGTINIAAGLVSYNYACCDEDSTHTGCGGGISTARNAYLSGTAVIEENYADLGGGFYITKDSYNGHLEMSGGIIRSNHAVKERPGVAECFGDGGGVAIDNDASFTMSGGIISSNLADHYGGAVVNLSGSSFEIKEAAYIPYNSLPACNDVYLNEGKKITLTERLTPPSECTNGIVATIMPDSYSDERVILALTSYSTTSIAVETPKFAVKPQTSPAQTWTIESDGTLALATKLTGSNIASFTSASLVADQEYHFVIGPDVTQAQFNTFIQKLCFKTTGNNEAETIIQEGSTLDLSLATNITSLGITSSTNCVYQKFDTIIIGPNFSTSAFYYQYCHNVFRETKRIIAPVNSTNFSSDSNGILYNKEGNTIVCYPGNSPVSNYVIPESVTAINGYAFAYVKATTSVTANSSVTIGDAAFFNAGGVTSVSLPDDNPQITIGCEFQGCGITSFTIPSSWTYLPNYTFRYSSLTTLTIPNTLTEIGREALPTSANFTSLVMTGTWETNGTSFTMTSDAAANASTYKSNYSEPWTRL